MIRSLTMLKLYTFLFKNFVNLAVNKNSFFDFFCNFTGVSIYLSQYTAIFKYKLIRKERKKRRRCRFHHSSAYISFFSPQALCPPIDYLYSDNRSNPQSLLQYSSSSSSLSSPLLISFLQSTQLLCLICQSHSILTFFYFCRHILVNQNS